MISDPTLTLPSVTARGVTLPPASMQSLPGEGTVPPPGKGEARKGSLVGSCKFLVEMYPNAKRSNH